jgi:hypothetical protein
MPAGASCEKCQAAMGAVATMAAADAAMSLSAQRPSLRGQPPPRPD